MITGFSVAGLAKRTPVEFENTSEEKAMAEQVERGLTLEATELTGADVPEDLDVAADGFVSRVVTGLRRHFGGDGDAVEKAATDNKCGIRVDTQEKKADKVDETPGSSPGQARGGVIRALREKKGWTIIERCGLAGNLVGGQRPFDPWSMAQSSVHRIEDLSVAISHFWQRAK